MARSSTLAEKQSFFDQLDRLGESDDEHTSIIGTPSEPPAHRPSGESRARSGRSLNDDPQTHVTKFNSITLRRSQTSPERLSLAANTKVQNSKPDSREKPGLLRSSSDKPTSEVHDGPNSKRKSRKAKDEVVLKPQEDRIFEGLTFFFVRNNDHDKGRRTRIRSAIAHGAIRTRTCSQEVTHVVVDLDLNFSQAAKAFSGGVVPQQALLVKDDWLTESVQYGERLDENAVRFKVKGAPARTQTGESTRNPPPMTSIAPKPVVPQKRKSHPSPNALSKTSQLNISDELGSIMERVRNSEDLPLGTDSDEAEDDQASLGSVVPESDSEGNSQSIAAEEVVSNHPGQVSGGFQCMDKHDGKNSGNPNAKTIEMLDKMSHYYDNTGDTWRSRSYRIAISALRKQRILVSTKRQAAAISGIGESIAEKIEEIVATNNLRKLEYTKEDSAEQVLQLFMGIYDVGKTQASKWIAHGHRTLDDLEKNVKLTSNQKTGIEHYSDFQERIPRAEVLQHANIVKRALQSTDPELEAIIGGSYRRGSKDSGDIDLIITKKDATIENIRTLMQNSVIPKLKSKGFLKATLASSSSTSPRATSSKWHGASCLPSSTTWRRIDFLFVPWDELGAALIYFTGNDIFNRSIRLLASKKGMRLNQHGLYRDVIRGPGEVKVTDGNLLEGRDEKRIFDLLGVPWRPPEHRKC